LQVIRAAWAFGVLLAGNLIPLAVERWVWLQLGYRQEYVEIVWHEIVCPQFLETVDVTVS